MRKTLIITQDDVTAENLARLLPPITGTNVSRYPLEFINSSAGIIRIPYLIGVANFLDIMVVKEPFCPIVALDKLIILDVPKYSATFWKQFHSVKIWDILTFVDNYPTYFLPNSTPPPFFLVPHAPRAPTQRQLFPILPTVAESIPTFYRQPWCAKKLTTRHWITINRQRQFIEHFYRFQMINLTTWCCLARSTYIC